MSALSFITRTRPVAAAGDRSHTGDQRLSMVGYRRSTDQVFLMESYQRDGEEPALFSMNLSGQYAGRLIPCREPANENEAFTALLPHRLAELSRSLRPLRMVDRGRFEITSRVVRRTALVIAADSPPVRKYTVKLALRAAGESAPTCAHHVTTYHRPNVSLERVYPIPDSERAVAIVSFIGMPYELGDRVEHAVLIALD